MRLVLKIGTLLAFMAVFMAAIVAAAKWAEGAPLAWWEWGLAGALPILIGIYLRYFSFLGCDGSQCLEDRQQHRFPGP